MKQAEVKYGLPQKVTFCKKCVMSNQMPSAVIELKHKKNDKKPTLNFDENGVCHACLYAEEKKHIDWTEREKQFKELLDEHRRNDGYYDVLVPSSGGKDSSMTAHMLKYKYNMNPLTVTWAPHIYTDIGWLNFQNLIHAGFDNILITPNGKVHKKLTQLAFKKLVHPFQPFVIGQKNVAPRVALEKNIKLIMYGENPAEYNSNVANNNSPIMKPEYFAVGESEKNNISLSGLSINELADYNIPQSELVPYMPLDISKIIENNIQTHYMSYYVNWNPQMNYYYASENVGFKCNTERTEGTYSKYSSIDDKTDGMHYFTTYVKFGIGRATYDAAQEIRNGHILREEGVALVKKYDGEFPKRYFKEFLEYININEEEFWEIINSARSPHLWKIKNDEWKLKHTCW